MLRASVAPGAPKRPHLPDVAAGDRLSHGDERAEEAGVVSWHEHDSGEAGGLDHAVGFLGVAGPRLFDQYVLTGGGRGRGDLGMAGVGRTDIDGVDVGAPEQLVPVTGHVSAAPFAPGRLSGLQAAAGEGEHVGAFRPRSRYTAAPGER